MKNLLLVLIFSIGAVFTMNAQKAEFLYFKANLPCCPAKSCNALEGDLKTLIETNYPKGDVVFKTIMIADEANKELVEQYNAKSQTCVLVVKNKKGDSYVDMSAMAKTYMVAKPDSKDISGKEFVLEVQKNLKK
jgi:hypothetical protein